MFATIRSWATVNLVQIAKQITIQMLSHQCSAGTWANKIPVMPCGTIARTPRSHLLHPSQDHLHRLFAAAVAEVHRSCRVGDTQKEQGDSHFATLSVAGCAMIAIVHECTHHRSTTPKRWWLQGFSGSKRLGTAIRNCHMVMYQKAGSPNATVPHKVDTGTLEMGAFSHVAIRPNQERTPPRSHAHTW